MKALMRKETGIFVLLLVVCIATGIKSHNFFSAQNLQNDSRLIGLYGIFSLGAGLVIITGGIDLSVGSMFALLGVLLAMMLSVKHYSPFVAVPLTLAVALGIGSFHGFMITRVKLQPFIVTLCGLLFYRGLARYISGDNSVGFGDAKGFEWLQKFSTEIVFGLPMPFIVLILLSIVMWVVLHRSVYGRHLFAIGRNEEAARYSGINTKRIVASAYVIAGLLTGIAAILFAFYTNSVIASEHGNFLELYGIAAAVLGGCSLRGGEGSVIGILLGVILLQILQNLVNLLGIPSSLNFAVMGAVILLGVLADQLLSSRAAARRTAKSG